jgi:NADH-quinone oxidoreductase subunit C
VIALSPLASPDVITSEGLACDLACFPTREKNYALVESVKGDGFEMSVDLCAVDYLEFDGWILPKSVASTRFEVVVNLLSLSKKQRVRVRIQAGDDEPEVDSLFSLYPGAEAMEREAFYLMGVLFTNHPDLTRILTLEEWEDHPLRKGCGSGRVPVQFKESPGPW